MIDSHEVVRLGLSVFLRESAKAEFEWCGEAGSVREAAAVLRMLAAEGNAPGIVITDVSYADGSGMDLIRSIVAPKNPPRVLAYSAHSAKDYALRVLHAGARGYIEKSQSLDELLKGLRALAENEYVFPPEVIQSMLASRGRRNGNGSCVPNEVLSDREFEVYQLIGEGLITRDIAEKLHLSPKTVETYRESIKKKLGLANASELTRQAILYVAQPM
jgi:DNA-binding NarL/FixJ family response regulator